MAELGAYPARKSRLPIIVALLILLAGGVALGVHLLFQRPGEAATTLIPSDADVVVTLDSMPSGRQAALYHRIDLALQKEGLDRDVTRGIDNAVKGSPVADEIRPHLKNSFAAAFWVAGSRGAETRTIVLLAVDNAGAVDSVLARHGTPAQTGKLNYYRFPSSVSAAVIGDYLVVGDAGVLARVDAVRNGAESVASLTAYREARSALPADAALMVFARPAQMSAVIDADQRPTFKSIAWSAMGATLRDDGIAFDYQSSMDAARNPSLKTLQEIRPFDRGVLDRVPANPYMVVAYSQPAKFYQYYQKAALPMPGSSPGSTVSPLDVDRDVLPGLNGNVLVAVYPDARGSDSGIDLVAYLDDANGSNPAALFEKLRSAAASGTGGDHFVSKQEGDATVWSLDSSTEQQVQQSIGGLTSMAPMVAPSLAANTSSLSRFYDNKTFTYARIGHTVLCATSKGMLEQALQAYNHRGASLSSASSNRLSPLVGNAQNLLLVDLGRIMDAVAPLIGKSTSSTGVSADDLAHLFGPAGASMVSSSTYDGRRVTGQLFFPMDYDRVIHLAGVIARNQEQHRPAPGTSV